MAIKQNLRRTTKTATQYPAIVVDTLGKRASARLSMNGAIVHNLQVVGGMVNIGQTVAVDYTTPEPTIKAVSRDWATQADLARMLAKYQIPTPIGAITEFDKVMLFSFDDPSEYHLFSGDRSGILNALDYAYTLDEEVLGEYNGFRHWAIRIPPFDHVPPGWEYDTSFYRPIHVFSEGVEGARILGYTHAMGGSTFENIHWYWNATQDKGQYPTYNLFLTLTGNEDSDYLMNDGNIIDPPPECYTTRFINCKFTCFGYDFWDGDEEPPVEHSAPETSHYYPWTNINLHAGHDGTNTPDVIFENCDFYAQSSDKLAWMSGAAVENSWLDGDNNGGCNLIFKNCRVNCGHTPIWVNWDASSSYPITENNVHDIISSNTRWEGVPDILTMLLGGAGNQEFILDDELDLSPIDHTHNYGGFDPNAIHLDVAGEYL